MSHHDLRYSGLHRHRRRDLLFAAAAPVEPEGAQKAADVLLHDVMPLMYTAYWLIFVRKGSLQWKDISGWLVYPLCYLAYALARGAFTDWYPYPFLDASKLGYLPVLLNAAMISCGFLGVSFVVVAFGRWSGRDRLPP